MSVVGRDDSRFWIYGGLLFAVWVNAIWPVIRVEYQPLNHLLFAAAQLLPVGMLASVVKWTGPWRTETMVFCVLLLFLSLPFGLGVGACGMDALGGDRSFEPLRSTPTAHGVVTTYRTNGGATTAYGIVLRQECRVLPGVILVEDVAEHYPSQLASRFCAWNAAVATGPYLSRRPFPLRL